MRNNKVSHHFRLQPVCSRAILFFMKQVYLSILISIIVNNFVCGQSSFFTLTEGWKNLAALEYDSFYVSIGLGFTGTFQNHLQFTKVDKEGNIMDEWIFKLDSTNTTEFSFQQAITVDANNNQIIAGTITYPSAPLTSIAVRLVFNNDFTEYSGNHWTYTPLDSPAQFRISYREGNDRLLHAVNYNYNGAVRSMLIETDLEGNLIWEQNYNCGVNVCSMEARQINAAHDGGYIFTNNERRGFAEGGIVGELDIGTIIKTDSLGVQQWRIRPGGVGEPYTSPHILLQPTDDGNYLCAWADNRVRTSDGTTFDHYNTNPNATIWFAKINSNGHKIWEKNIAEEIELWGTEEVVYLMDQMIRLPDDNFALTSYDQIIKINQNAEVIWARRVRPPELINTPNQYSEFYIKGVSVTSDGGFICTGELQINPGDVYPEYIQTGFVLKLDEYGCLEEGCQEDDPIVSVETPEVSEGKLLIYPNPADEYLIVEYAIIESSEASLLTITNINGQVVHQEKLNYPQDELVIITDKLPAGQYFCTISNSSKTVKTEKFILSK